ncbi:type II toxin-antitoxin system HicB family antitoxin [Peribacillus sp. SCS-37]|uniref:type II toxin-antitoxin system HicB family antitoxin n=1 Tax=Paraperibacillus esterisolvens TaxID=3115296 RepID=UPI003906A55F
MPSYRYAATIQKKEGAYVVKFPDLESCFAEGSTETEAIQLAEDTLRAYLSFCEDEKKEIPPPSGMRNVSEADRAIWVNVNTDYI